jgi:hypothetical protein
LLSLIIETQGENKEDEGWTRTEDDIWKVIKGTRIDTASASHSCMLKEAWLGWGGVKQRPIGCLEGPW